MNKGQFIGCLTPLLQDNRVGMIYGRNGSCVYDAGSLASFPKRQLLFIYVRPILPAAGYRNGTSINNVGSEGNYWSTTSASATNAYNVNFNGSNFNSANSNNRFNGFSVRLASVASALTLGSVILPAAGYRNGTSIVNVGSEGFYWSTTSASATNAYYVNFNGSNFNSANTWNGRCLGNSVRLASVALALTLGSVILPAAGYRNGTSIGGVGTDGNYWSTTSASATNAYRVGFNGSWFNSANSNNRFNGNSVRLASVALALPLAS